MKKIIGIKLLTIALILTVLATDSLAQTRIKFARGRSAATLSGSISSGGVREFVINVRSGQTMTIQVTSGNNKIDLEVTGRNGHLGWGDNGFAEVEINDNGDHYIALKNSGRAATRYSMTVTVR